MEQETWDLIKEEFKGIKEEQALSRQVMAKGFDKIDEKVEAGFKDMNGRIRRLENWRAALTGGWIVTIIGIGFIIKILW